MTKTFQRIKSSRSTDVIGSFQHIGHIFNLPDKFWGKPIPRKISWTVPEPLMIYQLIQTGRCIHQASYGDPIKNICYIYSKKSAHSTLSMVQLANGVLPFSVRYCDFSRLTNEYLKWTDIVHAKYFKFLREQK